MAELLFQFSTSLAFASTVIRRLTHSEFSHIDLILPHEGLLGVSGPDNTPPVDPGGVRIRPFNAWPYKFQPKVARVQCADEVVRKTIEFAKSQIGKPFDNGALYHFLRDRAGLKPIGRNWRDPDKWFCSELQVRALEVGGLFSYPLIVLKDVVSPQDVLLLLNPYMLPDNILEFTRESRP
jgi:hypothetical protein